MSYWRICPSDVTNTAISTISRWIKIIEANYYAFNIKLWIKQIKCSLKKEPKIYLWNWSDVTNLGAKIENFIAAQFLKAVHSIVYCL